MATKFNFPTLRSDPFREWCPEKYCFTFQTVECPDDIYKEEWVSVKPGPILNLTQHVATPAQLEAGVLEPLSADKAEIQELLTFDDIPSKAEIKDRARDLANKAAGLCSAPCDGGFGVQEGAKVMIGGAPYLMASLEEELRGWGLIPVYAFSRRESVETTAADGTVTKRNIFRHLGFVEA